MVKQIQDLVTWQSLRALGTSRTLRSSYYWFLLVPIAAKVLLQLPNPLTFQAFGQLYKIHLMLPFSWYALFFAAVAFATASFLFAAGCPSIIKSFKSFSEFYQKGYGVQTLGQMLFDVENRFAVEQVRFAILTVFYVGLKASNGGEAPPPPAAATAEVTADYLRRHLYDMKREELGDLFAVIVDVHNKRHPWLRVLIACWYAIGFALVFLILAQNVWTVIKMAIAIT